MNIIFSFDDYYNELKKYYEKHGNLDMRKKYCVETIKNDQVVTMKLGMYVSYLRLRYKGKTETLMTDEQIERLNNIGMIWDKNKNDDYISKEWSRMYNVAKKYYEKHGNLLIPTNYKVRINNNGNKKIVNIGRWISTQRSFYNDPKREISDKKIELLEKIGMVWQIQRNEEVIPISWQEKYDLAKKYYEKHGNLLIPVKYTIDVIDNEKEKTIPLGKWINHQRNSYKGAQGASRLTKKQIDLLNEIGMVWDSQLHNLVNRKINSKTKVKTMLQVEKMFLELLDNKENIKLTKNDIENINEEMILTLSKY